MATPSAGHALIAALEQGGYHLLEADKAAILAQCDSIADDFVNKATAAIANGLPSGGLKSVEFGPIKDALVSAEPGLDSATNDQIGKLFDLVATGVENASKS